MLAYLCIISVLSLDIMDDSGEHISGYTHDVYKVRLDSMGQLIDRQKETSKKKREWI